MATAVAEKSEILSPVASLRRLAKEISDEVQGDREELEARITYTLRKDVKRWIEALIDFAAEELARRTYKTERSAISKGPRPDRALAALVEEWDRYLEWPLRSGKPLKLATREDLMNESEWYRHQGKTMMARSDFFAQVARKMGQAETVGEAFDGKTLHELQEEAEATWSEA